jgi:hypothetical protein
MTVALWKERSGAASPSAATIDHLWMGTGTHEDVSGEQPGQVQSVSVEAQSASTCSLSAKLGAVPYALLLHQW